MSYKQRAVRRGYVHDYSISYSGHEVDHIYREGWWLCYDRITPFFDSVTPAKGPYSSAYAARLALNFELSRQRWCTTNFILLNRVGKIRYYLAKNYRTLPRPANKYVIDEKRIRRAYTAKARQFYRNGIEYK